MRKLLKGRKICAVACAATILLFEPTIFGAERENPISVRPAHINRLAVDSTNLASVGYDRDARVLEVEFRTGSIYRYRAVPADVFADLMSAPSKGRFFAREIRDKYQFQRMRTVQP